MGKKVILLAGMLGAGCTRTAEILSNKLNMNFINSEKVFREIVAQERISFADLSLMARSGEIDIEDVVKSVVEDHINEGNVIVEGRVALLVLNNPHVDLKVFLWAPKDFRVKRVAERRKIDEKEALEAIEESDEERSQLVSRLYKRDWLDADLYDIVINSSKWSFEEIADIIVAAYKAKIEHKS